MSYTLLRRQYDEMVAENARLTADLAAAREREQRLDVFREFAEASFAIEARYASGHPNLTPEMQTQWDDLCDRVGKALAAAAPASEAPVVTVHTDLPINPTTAAALGEMSRLVVEMIESKHAVSMQQEEDSDER